MPRPDAPARRARSPAADVPGSAITPIGVDASRGAGQRRGDRGLRRTRAAWLVVAGAARVGESADAVALVAGRSDDAHHVAARVPSRASATTSRGPSGARPALRSIRRERRAVPAVADEPVRRLGLELPASRVPGAGGEGDVADGAGDARHGGDAVDGRGGQSWARDDVEALGVLAAADRDRRVGADDRVGGGEASGARWRRARRPSAGRWRRRASRQARSRRTRRQAWRGVHGASGARCAACQAPSPVRRSATCSAVGACSSPASRPSAMKTTRSAHAAADGSWVTITSVPPVSSIVWRRRASTARPGARVERAGGLVGEDHARLADERAGDRDPLLLAARELRRPMAAALVEADELEDVADGRPAAACPRALAGSPTFCSAVSAPSRLNDWKTKPIRSRRRRASARSFSRPSWCSAEVDVALRRAVEARRRAGAASSCRSPRVP